MKSKDWKIGINTPSITNFENDIELIFLLIIFQLQLQVITEIFI